MVVTPRALEEEYDRLTPQECDHATQLEARIDEALRAHPDPRAWPLQVGPLVPAPARVLRELVGRYYRAGWDVIIEREGKALSFRPFRPYAEATGPGWDDLP